MQQTPGEAPWLNQQSPQSDSSSEVDVEQDGKSSTVVGEELSRTDTRGGYGERRGNAVSYENAVNNYEELRRELTQQSRRMSVSLGEKGGMDEFDLNDYLTDAKAKSEEAGINRKSLGLIWRNLTVKVSGSGGTKLLHRMRDTSVFNNHLLKKSLHLLSFSNNRVSELMPNILELSSVGLKEL